MESQTSSQIKEIPIDILENIQIDLKPEKPKKRRKIDDYDYNDPFLEPFEGEFDAVELECKLENFFVYKGQITEDPKRIARRYTNSLKKRKFIDIAQHNEQEKNKEAKEELIFDFEKRLIKVTSQSNKYKKDARFENAVIWKIFTRRAQSDFETYLRQQTLIAFGKEKEQQIDQTPDSLKASFEKMHAKIEFMFKSLMTEASLEKNFSTDMKSFEKFKDMAYLEKMTEFVVQYVMFRVCKLSTPPNLAKNYAIEYLSAMLPEKCTNKTKTKYYILKAICADIGRSEYNLEKALDGEFIKENTTQESQSTPSKPTPSKPTVGNKGINTSKASNKLLKTPKSPVTTPLEESANDTISLATSFKPSFDENSISIGSELNPSLTTSFPASTDDGKFLLGKNKKYSHPTFPLFSASFLNPKRLVGTTKMEQAIRKPNNPENNVTGESINSDDAKLNISKGSSEYASPTHSIDEERKRSPSSSKKTQKDDNTLSLSNNLASTIMDDSYIDDENSLSFD